MYAIIEPLSQLKIENVSEVGLIKTISLLQVLLSATICRVQSQDTECGGSLQDFESFSGGRQQVGSSSGRLQLQQSGKVIAAAPCPTCPLAAAACC